MSSGRLRSDSAPEPGPDIGGTSDGRRSRAATVQESSIEPVKESSEPPSPIPELRPRLKEVRRGVLSISQASVPVAQSSPIMAEGKVFASQKVELDHEATKVAQSQQSSLQAQDLPLEEADMEQKPAEDIEQDQDHDSASHTSSCDDPNQGHAKCKALEVALSEVQQKEHTVSEDLERLSPEPTPLVPTIEVHRPSNAESTMAAPGEGAVNAAAGNTPATTVPSSVGGGTPAAPAASPDVANPAAFPANPPVLSNAPLQAASVLANLADNVPPVETPTVPTPNVAIPAVDVPGTPAVGAPKLPVLGGKVKKRKRVVGKARKMILRKKVLSMILGRELAGTVHPLLSGAGAATGPVVLPEGVPAVAL